MKIVYHPNSKIGFPILDALHPFDTNKFKRARKMLLASHPDLYRSAEILERGEVSREVLRTIHSDGYLDNLQYSSFVARAIEVPLARWLPGFMLDYCICRPMRRSTQATLRAVEAALEDGVAAALGGGFHHAKPHQGEGFCLYADIGLAMSKVPGSILYVDLDVHMGNGVAYTAMDEPRIKLFDMYNKEIYPARSDRRAAARLNHPVPITSGTTGRLYLERLESELPAFIKQAVAGEQPSLIVYTAGTDVLDGDPLGGVHLSPEDILARDMLVYRLAKTYGIPLLYLPGGGYTKESASLIAASLGAMLDAETVAV